MLTFAHLIGLAFALGAATAKVALLLRCRRDPSFVATYLQVIPSLTKLIVTGLVLLTVSGVIWLVQGYGFTPQLGVKLALVAAVWVMGPIIDKVAEPKFRALAPSAGSPASAPFAAAQQQYLMLELAATLTFYAIVAVWVLV